MEHPKKNKCTCKNCTTTITDLLEVLLESKGDLLVLHVAEDTHLYLSTGRGTRHLDRFVERNANYRGTPDESKDKIEGLEA